MVRKRWACPNLFFTRHPRNVCWRDYADTPQAPSAKRPILNRKYFSFVSKGLDSYVVFGQRSQAAKSLNHLPLRHDTRNLDNPSPSSRHRQRSKMRWSKPNIRSGMHSLLGKSSPAAAVDRDAHIEAIRNAMLLCLEPFTDHSDRHFVQVQNRIRFCTNAEDLWYLRGDVMALLSATRGELAARQSVDGLAPLFEGLLPRSLTDRPARLRH